MRLAGHFGGPPVDHDSYDYPGDAAGAWADHPMVALVLHINREVMHHGAEIAPPRELYRHRNREGTS